MKVFSEISHIYEKGEGADATESIYPAIFVPELKKIIYGCESWWKTIQSVDEFSKISNEDINNTWYVKLLQSLNHTEEK